MSSPHFQPAAADALPLGGEVQARIAALFIYPVKSCAGVALQESTLAETGLALDRAWMVVDAGGCFITQRQAPRMALVQVSLEGSSLVLRAPGMPALEVPGTPPSGPAAATLAAQVWNDEVPAQDMGAQAAQWFSDFLGQRARLVRFPAGHRRLSSRKWTGGLEAPNLFSDGYPVLVLSQASLDGLNQRLQAVGRAPVEMARFRPNLVLEGLQAHDEDRLGPIVVEADRPVWLQAVKPCPRCPIPNIDPATGLSEPSVGNALAAYRALASMDGAVCFGMNAIVRAGAGARLRVGQALRADWRFD